MPASRTRPATDRSSESWGSARSDINFLNGDDSDIFVRVQAVSISRDHPAEPS